MFFINILKSMMIFHVGQLRNAMLFVCQNTELCQQLIRAIGYQKTTPRSLHPFLDKMDLLMLEKLTLIKSILAYLAQLMWCQILPRQQDRRARLHQLDAASNQKHKRHCQKANGKCSNGYEVDTFTFLYNNGPSDLFFRSASRHERICSSLF